MKKNEKGSIILKILLNYRFKMVLGYVHTLGDSTLDDLFWMLKNSDLKSAKQNSVEGTLKKHVKVDGFKVVSHAYDGFTTKSVLRGDRIGAVLPYYEEKDLYMKEKAARGFYAKPLTTLENKITEAPNVPHYVVISVGGNDFRENLRNPLKLLKDIPQIQKRYLEIVEKVKGLGSHNVHPILMLQYRTDANNDPYLIYTLLKVIGIAAFFTHVTSIALMTAPLWAVAGQVSALAGGLLFFGGALGLYLSQKVVPLSVTKDVFLGKKIGMSMLGALMQKFYQPILEYAKKERIPLLDLPNTFNPYEKLYISGIEPGKEGGKLIAEGIHHIVKNHDFTKESALYSKWGKQPTFTATLNKTPSAWRAVYPS